MGTVKILGFNISNNGLNADADTAMEFIKTQNKAGYMACANPHSLVESDNDPVFRDALKTADILLPDGVGILLAARILKLFIPERVAGTEFFLALSERCNKQKNVKVFFLGSTQKVLDKLISKSRSDFPNIDVCGFYSPPFDEIFSQYDNDLIIDAINNAKPDVLWVGMTAPKQEKWIYENLDKLNVQFIGAIGAVFDFYAGTKKRAPEWLCRLGLEWLPRLLREPKRLWRRNFISTPLFLWKIYKQRFGYLY